MPKKSDKRRVTRISATKASRSFSRLLDQIESGKSFLIQRRGREVCLMAPASSGGRRASVCLEILRDRPPVLLDDRFGKDLLEVLRTEPVEERPSWDS